MRAALLVAGQPQRRAQALFDRGVASRAGEDERDGGQQPPRSSTLITSGRDGVRYRLGRPRPAAGPRGCQSASRSASRRFAMWRSNSGSTSRSRPASPDRRRVVEQVEQSLADHHVLPQRHRPVFVDHHRGVAPHRLNPAAELLGVAHCRRQADQPHVVGQVQNHLFPHGTAHPVGQEVHLVHHDVGKPMQRSESAYSMLRSTSVVITTTSALAVDRLVAGQQSDALRPVAAHQVGVLLVAQRLDRCGVEALSARRQREVHGELAHHGLARAGRRAHQHAVALLQRLAGAALEGVERERQLCGERCRRARVPALRWRRHRPQRDGVGTAVGASIGSAAPIGAASSSGTRRRLPARLALVVEPRDLDGEFEQKGQRQRQRQHREGIRSRGEERGEDEQPEDQAASPRLEPLVGEHSDKVQHDDQQRELEADAEHQQQVDQEAEVLVARQRGDLHVAADGQQELQCLGQHHVGQHRPGDEQHRAERHEADREPALLAVEARA